MGKESGFSLSACGDAQAGNPFYEGNGGQECPPSFRNEKMCGFVPVVAISPLLVQMRSAIQGLPDVLGHPFGQLEIGGRPEVNVVW